MTKLTTVFILIILVFISFVNLNIFADIDFKTPNYTTQNNKIFRNNQEIQLKGISWFGAEGKNALIPHGIWARSYVDIIKQIKSLGFNSVRLPFCPAVLKNNTTGYIELRTNPNLEGKKSLDVLDIIMDEMRKQELYVLLDHHRPDCETISELWYTDTYSEKDWIADLKFVAKRYRTNPYFMGLDIKNEPHGKSTWSKTSPKTDWNKAAERAGQAILAVNPNILIFVEGIGENRVNGVLDCEAEYSKWWGGNLSPIACYPIDKNYIPAKKLVLSPHAYGPDVYYQGYFDNDIQSFMPQVWDKHFSFAIDKGYTLAIGEFGGRYEVGSKDRIWQNTFIDYLINKKICSSYFWTLNPESGDTGGILNDDWLTVNTDKYNNLRRLHLACDELLKKPNTSSSSSASKSSSSINSSSLSQSSSVSSASSSSLSSVSNSSSQSSSSAPNSKVKVDYYEFASWEGTKSCGKFVMKNTTNESIKNWKVKFLGKIKILTKWNLDLNQDDNSNIAKPSENWNKTIKPQEYTEFGFCSEKLDDKSVRDVIFENE
jgi:endoglucanase